MILLLTLLAQDLPRVFSDRMVLQQDAPIAVWGIATPNASVRVEFGEIAAEAKADVDGRFRAELPPMKADGKARDLLVGTRRLKDVVLGEVWLCAGQSNMNRGIDLTKEQRRDLRLFWIDYTVAPNEDGMAGWVPSTPDGLASAAVVSEGPNKGKPRTSFSEVGYTFGRRLQEELKVPVGLIVAAVGGSKASTWTPMGDVVEPGPRPAHTPGLLYASMIRGLVPFRIRGVAWYQGEDDGRTPDYGRDLAALIHGWRKAWGNEEMPFYFAQIASTTYAGGMLGVWEGQIQVARAVPHTGLAPSNDIYDGTPNGDFKERIDPTSGWPLAGGGNPHPTNRPLVATRMADIALVKTYGRPERPVFGPTYKAHRVEGGKVIVEFDFAEGLRTRDGKDPDWFELKDGERWVKASAKIVDGRVELSGSGPGVRFGWHSLARWNLVNAAGLPALPFRR